MKAKQLILCILITVLMLNASRSNPMYEKDGNPQSSAIGAQKIIGDYDLSIRRTSGSGSWSDPYYLTFNDINTVVEYDDTNIFYSLYIEDTTSPLIIDSNFIAGYTATANEDAALLYLVNCRNVIISGIEFDTSDSLFNTSIVKLVNCRDIIIENTNFTDQIRSNIDSANANPMWGVMCINSINITIQSNIFHRTWNGLSFTNTTGLILSNTFNITSNDPDTLYGNYSIYGNGSRLLINNNTFNAADFIHEAEIFLNASDYSNITNNIMNNCAYYGVILWNTSHYLIQSNQFTGVAERFHYSPYGLILNNSFQNLLSTAIHGGNFCIVNWSNYVNISFNFFSITQNIALWYYRSTRGVINSNIFQKSEIGCKISTSSNENEVHNNVFSGSTTPQKNDLNIEIIDSAANYFYRNIFYNVTINEDPLITITGTGSANNWNRLINDRIWGNYWADYLFHYGTDVLIIDGYYWNTDYEIDELNIDYYPLITNYADKPLAFTSTPADIVRDYTEIQESEFIWIFQTNKTFQYPVYYEIRQNNTIIAFSIVNIVDIVQTAIIYLTYHMPIGTYNITCIVTNGITTINDTAFGYIINDKPIVSAIYNADVGNITINIYDRVHTSLRYTIYYNSVAKNGYTDIFINGEDEFNYTTTFRHPDRYEGTYNYTIIVIDDLPDGTTEYNYIFIIEPNYTWLYILIGVISGVIVIIIAMWLQNTMCQPSNASIACKIKNVFQKK